MKKIVLVEDNKYFLNEVKEFLEYTKTLECVAFFEPERALKYILKEKGIDVVITDYEMPGMNGFMLAQKILDVFPGMRIIVMSGHYIDDLRKFAQKAGFDESKIELFDKGNIFELPKMLNT